MTGSDSFYPLEPNHPCGMVPRRPGHYCWCNEAGICSQGLPRKPDFPSHDVFILREGPSCTNDVACRATTSGGLSGGRGAMGKCCCYFDNKVMCQDTQKGGEEQAETRGGFGFTISRDRPRIFCRWNGVCINRDTASFPLWFIKQTALGHWTWAEYEVLRKSAEMLILFQTFLFLEYIVFNPQFSAVDPQKAIELFISEKLMPYFALQFPPPDAKHKERENFKQRFGELTDRVRFWWQNTLVEEDASCHEDRCRMTLADRRPWEVVGSYLKTSTIRKWLFELLYYLKPTAPTDERQLQKLKNKGIELSSSSWRETSPLRRVLRLISKAEGEEPTDTKSLNEFNHMSQLAVLDKRTFVKLNLYDGIEDAGEKESDTGPLQSQETRPFDISHFYRFVANMLLDPCKDTSKALKEPRQGVCGTMSADAVIDSYFALRSNSPKTADEAAGLKDVVEQLCQLESALRKDFSELSEYDGTGRDAFRCKVFRLLWARSKMTFDEFRRRLNLLFIWREETLTHLGDYTAIIKLWRPVDSGHMQPLRPQEMGALPLWWTLILELAWLVERWLMECEADGVFSWLGWAGGDAPDVHIERKRTLFRQLVGGDGGEITLEQFRRIDEWSFYDELYKITTDGRQQGESVRRSLLERFCFELILVVELFALRLRPDLKSVIGDQKQWQWLHDITGWILSPVPANFPRLENVQNALDTKRVYLHSISLYGHHLMEGYDRWREKEVAGAFAAEEGERFKVAVAEESGGVDVSSIVRMIVNKMKGGHDVAFCDEFPKCSDTTPSSPETQQDDSEQEEIEQSETDRNYERVATLVLRRIQHLSVQIVFDYESVVSGWASFKQRYSEAAEQFYTQYQLITTNAVSFPGMEQLGRQYAEWEAWVRHILDFLERGDEQLVAGGRLPLYLFISGFEYLVGVTETLSFRQDLMDILTMHRSADKCERIRLLFSQLAQGQSYITLDEFILLFMRQNTFDSTILEPPPELPLPPLPVAEPPRNVSVNLPKAPTEELSPPSVDEATVPRGGVLTPPEPKPKTPSEEQPPTDVSVHVTKAPTDELVTSPPSVGGGATVPSGPVLTPPQPKPETAGTPDPTKQPPRKPKRRKQPPRVPVGVLPPPSVSDLGGPYSDGFSGPHHPRRRLGSGTYVRHDYVFGFGPSVARDAGRALYPYGGVSVSEGGMVGCPEDEDRVMNVTSGASGCANGNGTDGDRERY
ncbi:unnamed protein product [Vitrella brassicaformis CCMP3155]|uniref:Uncharacterized protein n=2 Tax=Vitrella brassicaformis TaxID=1169539 RepID=A0A0G4EPG6_VITBC|nr:unnamed protein product [Vitrella brassicaformis CCMP3155]|eukprot:CEL99329.1 unnamed protein product [Vitrella brassicaformis CCMP3155]